MKKKTNQTKVNKTLNTLRTRSVKTCSQCHKSFYALKIQRFCSTDCRAKWHREQVKTEKEGMLRDHEMISPTEIRMRGDQMVILLKKSDAKEKQKEDVRKLMQIAINLNIKTVKIYEYTKSTHKLKSWQR